LKLRAPQPILLRAVRSSAAVEAWYRKELTRLVDEMHKSVLHWVRKVYPPPGADIAMDAPAIGALNSTMKNLGRRWDKQFTQLSHETSKKFAKLEYEYNEKAFKQSLKDSGFAIKHELAAPMREALPAMVEENVALIKSIPEKYFGEIENKVMESVERGRDMAELTEQLQARYGVTRGRAELIARDQNNKATAQLQKAGQLSVGITTAMWSHTTASITPREDHADFDGEEYDVELGHDFGDGFGPVLPGEAINCGCTSHPIIPGFNDEEA